MSQSSDQQAQTAPYKWVNKEEFQNSNLEEEVKPLLTPQPEEIEEENIAKLLFKVMKSSKVGVLHFNDQTKQMSIYNQPSTMAITELSNGHFRYFKFFDDIRNRFSYIFNTEYRLGERGANCYISAFQKRHSFKYSIGYSKTLWERVDNNFRTNVDEISLHTMQNNLKFANSLQFFIARESRQNYIDYFNKNDEKNHKFNSNEPDVGLPKHSNLLSLKYIYKYAPLTVTGKFGIDFGNKSVFKSLNLFVGKNFVLGDSVMVKTSASYANIWGKNVLKNDYFFGSNESWHGQKFKNFTSARVELLLLKYPYISLFKIFPHIYTQLWVALGDRERQRFDSKYFAEYGIGLSSAENGLKFDIALFNGSLERKDEVLGALKFSF